jgi:CubicO group peptidase (beta-lactamase class C family)
LVGIAINEGYIKGIDDPITNYLPELIEKDTRFKKITIKHLLLMCSGIEKPEAKIGSIPLPWDGDPIAYYHPYRRDYILTRLRIISEPGNHFYYNDFNTELLGVILERTTGKSVSKFLEEKIWKPIGMEYPALWCLDSKRSGFERMSSGLFARARDYAKFARLFLNRGKWGDRLIIPEDWVLDSIQDDRIYFKGDYFSDGFVKDNHHYMYYKYHWKGFVNSDSTFSVAINGDKGQSVYLVPHKDLIIVRCGISGRYIDEMLWFSERTMENPFYDTIKHDGVSAAVQMYYERIKTDTELFGEYHLNRLAHIYLRTGKVQDALDLFKLNVQAYPDSWKVYDNLAFGYSKMGNKKQAVKYLKMSLKMNPNNKSIKMKLKKLENKSSQ